MNQSLAPYVLAAAALACLPARAVDAGDAPPPFAGRWLTQTGNLEVEIAPCATGWCGTVVRQLANRSMSRDGAPMANPTPAIGLVLLRDLRPPHCEASSGDPIAVGSLDCQAWTGTLHNRETGRDYRATVALDGTGGLIVRPYVGVPLIGKTLPWQRVTGVAAASTAGQ